MINPLQLKASIVALTVLGAVAGAGGPANAAHTLRPAHASKNGEPNQAKLRHGVLRVKGTHADDRIALRLKAGDPGIVQVDTDDDDTAEFSFDRADIAKIRVKAGPGDDVVRIDEVNGSFTDTIPTTLDGGDGDDRLAGGSGAELLLGGDGNDTIDGNRGADVAQMGDGDDTFIWDPGDGSDVVEGQDGADTMRFNGADLAEQFELSANGNRLRFTRNLGNVTMDTDGVERVDVNALGGADLVTVNDLSGTDVKRVNADLASTSGSGDGAADRVVVNATAGDDAINVSGNAAGVNVTGLAAAIGVLHSEAANDKLEINTLTGADTVSSGALAPGVIQLFVDGALVS